MLRNSNFRIIPLEKRHLESVRLLRNDPDTTYYLTSVVPINELSQEAWFTAMSQDATKMYLTILGANDICIGIVRLDEWDKINRSIRVGIDIVPQMRRKGFATQAYLLVLDYLFFQLGIHRAWLLVVVFNSHAISLYKKLGFIEEGRMREAIFRDNGFNDYIIMSLLADEYEKKRK